MTSMMTDKAASFADELRQLAAVLDEHPEMAGRFPSFALNIFVDSAEELAGMIRAAAGRWEKHKDDNYLWGRYTISANVYIDVNVRHEQVCERVVVGTEKVLVPDPNAPKVEVEREIVEWQCPPSLLAVGAKS